MSVPLMLFHHSEKKSKGILHIAQNFEERYAFGVRLSSREDFMLISLRQDRLLFCKTLHFMSMLAGCNVDRTRQYSTLLKAGSPRLKL